MSDSHDKSLAEVHALHQAGQQAAALRQLAGLTTTHASDINYWFLSAAINLALGQLQRALDAGRAAQALEPDNPDVYFNLGVIYQAQGKDKEAGSAYRTALELSPHHSNTLRNYPSILTKQGKTSEAISLSESALRHYPQDALLHYNHAELFIGTGQGALAQSAFEAALSIQPDLHLAKLGLSVALAIQGDLPAAYSTQAEALAADPSLHQSYRSPLRGDASKQGAPDPARVAALACADRIRQYHWVSYESDIALLEGLIGGEWGAPLCSVEMAYLSLLTPLSSATRQKLARQCAAALKLDTRNARIFRPTHAPRQNKKLTIAYLSADFRAHPVGRFMAHSIARHDRSRFRVLAYSTGPDDHSAERSQVMAAVDLFTDARHTPPLSIAQKMVHDQVDILIDLSGYTLDAQPATLMFRPAPIQIGFLGYYGTMGSEFVDYTLSDKRALLASERPFWDETIAYLPHCYSPCIPRPASIKQLGRDAFGLPSDRFVFGALHHPRKVNPACMALWFKVLIQCPDTVLWLLSECAEQQQAVYVLADDCGIKHERLFFTDTTDLATHLGRNTCADIILDVPHYNGHTTTVDALACGLPVITLGGVKPLERIGATLLSAHGLPELIANDEAGFIDIARRYVNDLDWQKEIRARTAQYAHSNLTNPERWVRDLERAYELMWQRHQADLPPADFDVPSA